MNTFKKSGALTAHLPTWVVAEVARESSTRVEPALLTVDQAAQLLGVSRRKFHSLRTGLPAPVVLGARVVRWRTADLRGYVEQLAATGPRSEPSHLAAARARKKGSHDGVGAALAGTTAIEPESEPARGSGKRPAQSNSNATTRRATS